mgnify:CR=1 FL=1
MVLIGAETMSPPRRRLPRSEARARILAGGTTLDVAPCDDLNFQATTRGGRVMDHVLANKLDPKPRSGRQEMLENLVNRYL